MGTNRPSKRWIASKLRQAANLLPGHWIQHNYFGIRDGERCMCAHGGVFSVSWSGAGGAEVVRPTAMAAAARAVPAVAEAAEEAATAAVAEVAAAASMRRVRAATCPSYVTEKQAFWAHYYAQLYGVTFTYNDTPGRTEDEVTSALRRAAYMVEHGGKTYAEVKAATKARRTANGVQ